MYDLKLRFLMTNHEINSTNGLMKSTKISNEPLAKLYSEEKLTTLKLDVLERIWDNFNYPHTRLNQVYSKKE